LSRVFDARKHAERSKLAREAVAGVAQSPQSGSPSEDTLVTASLPDGPQETNGTRTAAQGPIVRSLLRMPRAELRPTPISEAKQSADAEPATLILPEDPIYPAVAKECSISGRVEVQFRISPEGNVYDARSVRGVPILARAAVEAVEARLYEPARLNGAPIDSQATTHFDFRLS
jgi:TonB family protein